ncbi:hypothetical protein HDU93_010030, partial [Gonapodya sp. JEL0774]
MTDITEANSRLILAIEAGRMDQVQSAIRDGADVNLARKQVWLRAELEDTGEEVESVIEAEDAMVLAIRDKRADIVRTLLDAGYEPNQPVSWKLGLPRAKWISKTWKVPGPWDIRAGAAPTFQSVLELALTHRRLRFSPSGDPVELDTPTKEDDVCAIRAVIPAVEVARALLKAGAVVTKKELAAAESVGGGKGGELYELVASFADETVLSRAEREGEEIMEDIKVSKNTLVEREPEPKKITAPIPVKETAEAGVDATVVPEQDTTSTQELKEGEATVPEASTTKTTVPATIGRDSNPEPTTPAITIPLPDTEGGAPVAPPPLPPLGTKPVRSDSRPASPVPMNSEAEQ